MVIERLSFRHKDLLAERLRKISEPLSEFSFANLYLFRRVHQYEVILDDHVFVRGRSYDGLTFIMLTEMPDRMGAACLKKQLLQADMLFPVPEAWLPLFPAPEFEPEFREGDADYLYTVEKMSTYAGRRLHKKRNLLKQFVEAYQHNALPLTLDRIRDAQYVLEAWNAESDLDPADSDYDPCREALELYEELSLCGGIYYADGEPAGFVLGEEVNDETYVLHFAKARTKFKGVYQFMFNNFARILPPKYRFLNLEQDLERENLRVFKTSYVPDAMLRKARVRMKQGVIPFVPDPDPY